VVAWNLIGCVEPAALSVVAVPVVKHVKVQGRLEAGVPVKVFRTWQVIGSRDISVAGFCILMEVFDVDWGTGELW
jgi:hypothetical protein